MEDRLFREAIVALEPAFDRTRSRLRCTGESGEEADANESLEGSTTGLKICLDDLWL
jgi:hypothetical protein